MAVVDSKVVRMGRVKGQLTLDGGGWGQGEDNASDFP